MASVQTIFHLPGRKMEGFLNSISRLIGVDLTAPDHTTLSRRRSKLSITLPVREFARARHVVMDSTGVKIYGEGEWKVRQHGISKRRTWRKLHLCVDEKTQKIVSLCASTNDVSDDQTLPELLSEIIPDEITQVSGDGAYDKRKCYDAINQLQSDLWRPVADPISAEPIQRNGAELRYIESNDCPRNAGDIQGVRLIRSATIEDRKFVQQSRLIISIDS